MGLAEMGGIIRPRPTSTAGKKNKKKLKNFSKTLDKCLNL
jgi:hypothetical protein